MKDMDHVTSNAISELASQLGRPLRDELNSHIELFQQSLLEMSSSMKKSENSLMYAANELLPKIEVAKKELDSAVQCISDSSESIRGGLIESLDDKITAILDNNERIVNSLRDELSSVTRDLILVENALDESSNNLTGTNQDLANKAAVFMDEIENWNGLLKARSHAQTKELEALSSEISELINNMKSRLLDEIDEQIDLRDNRVRKDLAENNAIYKQLFYRIARIEKSVWVVASIIALTIIIVLFLI